MKINIKRADKDFVSIAKIQAQISAETLMLRKSVDAETFHRPMEDRTEEYLQRFAEIEAKLGAGHKLIDITPEEPEEA